MWIMQRGSWQRKNKTEVWDNGKLPELNVLSGIAIICVVLIHSNAGYLLSILGLKTYTEAGFNVRLLDNFIHGAVPLFIFIAGYKYAFNNSEDEYKTYFKKKMARVFRPFLAISLILFVRYIAMQPEKYSSLGEIGIQILYVLIGKYRPAYHLWYIPMYLFIVLTYPCIYKVCRSNKVRVGTIAVIVLLHGLLGSRFDFLLERPFDFVYYYMFFEMGVLFCKHNLKDKIEKWKIPLISAYIAGAVLLTANPIPEIYDVVQKYLLWSLGIVAYYALSLILCDNRLLSYLGKYSFYIYLLHEPIILTKIFWFIIGLGIYNSHIWVFVVGILALGVSLVLYKIIEKTPIKELLFGK